MRKTFTFEILLSALQTSCSATNLTNSYNCIFSMFAPKFVTFATHSLTLALYLLFFSSIAFAIFCTAKHHLAYLTSGQTLLHSILIISKLPKFRKRNQMFVLRGTFLPSGMIFGKQSSLFSVLCNE